MGNRYRAYNPSDVNDARIINALKFAGMSLQDIKIVLDLKRREISTLCQEDTLKFIRKYIDSINSKIILLKEINRIFETVIESIVTSEEYDEEKLISLISGLSIGGENQV